MTAISPGGTPSAEPRATSRVLHLSRVLVGLLVLEAIIGIGLATYVTIPASPSFMTVFASIPLLTAHILLAFLLAIVALYATLLARRLAVPGVVLWEALVTVFLLFAIQEGFAFAFDQNNMYVGGMVLGFLAALVLQAVVTVRLSRRRRGLASAAASSPGA